MRKGLIISLIVVVAIVFGVLVFFGIRYARGVPVAVTEPTRQRLAIPYLDREINLDDGIDSDFWLGLEKQRIGLVFQVMALPWPQGKESEHPSEMDVSAFHNNEDIYIYMEWPDETEDLEVSPGLFPDAGAVMFSLDPEAQPSTLMMGFLHKANIWFWKADRNRSHWMGEPAATTVYADFHYPFEEEELFIVSEDKISAAVEDLIAIRVGTVSSKPEQRVQGRGIYEAGKWRVLFKRSLNVSDREIDVGFDSPTGLFAVAVWNGSAGDRGGRKSISEWVELDIE